VAGKVAVRMDFDDGNAHGTTVDSYFDGLKVARKWLDEYIETRSSEALPAIIGFYIERVTPPEPAPAKPQIAQNRFAFPSRER
jgi:hypothetical protein